ncbi:unnamed protein product [Dibothriocephalus latus]|uniref:JAB1/MPN/MOV34 metalloenzyme domain-containing protein n=1 Tax=Dibothriocephalus latus TaxID=60516 RepID=A0A3P7NBE2_DIBLA|nr:unnamed protein product [Dibothriocephalus latus]
MPRLVTVTPEAYQTMLLHAFTHEREEVGGVLVGQADEKQTFVITVIPLKRASQETEGEAVHKQQRSSRVHVTDVELAECIPKCEVGI